MSQIETSKPSLPSIQYLLQENSQQQNDIIQGHTKRHYGHRTSRSISSLPLDLQNLSLHGPAFDKKQFIYDIKPEPYNGMPCLSNENPPSWMLPNSIPKDTVITKTRLVSGGHGRSISEYSLPLVFPYSSTTTALLPPQSPRRHVDRTHRRAASANTVDSMLTRAPKEQQPITTITITSISSNEIKLDQDNGEGRYVCPNCQKKFSRPSSLRIHIYSHTGEKPFACTEPGCNRHFSVQSNMRRHLRIHRGRPVNNSSEILSK